MLSELRNYSEDHGSTISFTPQERRDIDTRGNLYALIRTTEHLERAFVNGSIPSSIYEQKCAELITQFKTVKNALKHDTDDILAFMREHSMDCPLATERLCGTGVTATKLHQDLSDPKNESLHVFEASQHLTTCIDALKLGMRCVDEILPPLKDTLISLNKISALKTMEGREKLENWVRTLNQYAADHELSDAQVRQLQFDLEDIHHNFYTCLREV